MTGADEAMLRTANAARDALAVKRNALQVALAESATAFHKAMKHTASDWRGGCAENECRKAWAALSAHGGK